MSYEKRGCMPEKAVRIIETFIRGYADASCVSWILKCVIFLCEMHTGREWVAKRVKTCGRRVTCSRKDQLNAIPHSTEVL